MEEAGPSITVTSLTNVLSFTIGALTGTMAIQIFCLYAAVGVLFDFFYQVGYFISALTCSQFHLRLFSIFCSSQVDCLHKKKKNEMKLDT